MDDSAPLRGINKHPHLDPLPPPLPVPPHDYDRIHGRPSPSDPLRPPFPFTPPDYDRIREQLSGHSSSSHLLGITKILASEGLHFDHRQPVTKPKKKNFADVLIQKNRDIWWGNMYNRFCWTMAVSPIPVDPHFKEYCEQDYAAIWAYVRHMAWKASACADIQDVIRDASTIAEVQLFAMDWKDLVMDNFGSRGYEVDQKKLTQAMEDYIKWMQAEARMAGETRDYFRLNVVMTPCIFGYPMICKLLKRHIPPNELNKLFDSVWIVPNDTDHFINQIRAYFDSVPARDPDDYKEIFRTAVQHEIDVFNSFLPPFVLPWLFPPFFPFQKFDQFPSKEDDFLASLIDHSGVPDV